ncbi:MAG: ATP-binding protein [Planctomycetaceae bacterium]
MDNETVLPPVDWKQVADQLRNDPESMLRSERVALLTGQTEAWGAPSDDLVSVLELLARDPKWEVRRHVAEVLPQLPEEVFRQLASVLTQDQNHYVRKSAERALDRRRRGERNALARSKKSGELAAEYDSMERLYGSLPARKARRIVEKHFDMLVGGTVHNMRGLLTPIKHNAEELNALAKSGAIDKRRLGQHARAIVTRLADLEQFLDDMRAYAQPLPTQRRRERLIDLVREAADAARAYFEATGYDPTAIEVRFHVPKSLSVEVARHQVLSVFTNLLRNAFEAFRPIRDEVGPFWIAVSATLDIDRVHILIEDNGVGFGEDDLRQIREFIPGHKTMKHDGTGFGLPTARRYIEGHGGSLDIDSQIQAGTKVRIVLPIESTGEPPE